MRNAWRLVRSTILFGTIVFGSAPATAAWLRAESTHFIVYSDDKESAVRDLATDLELYDSVLRWFHAMPEEDAAGSNKLTVFVVNNIAAVQRLCGKCADVAGFYVGRASGSIAFTPRRILGTSDNDMKPVTVLQHEYAHHFMFANFHLAYPAWFSEGYAEFASTFRDTKDTLTVGAAAMHRAWGLFSTTELTARMLFDAENQKLRSEQRELLYGRGWLLTHYVMFDPERRKQFDAYIALVNSGTPSVAAATKAFGDLAALDKALDKYLNAKTLKAIVVKRSTVPEPKVTVTTVPDGQAQMMPVRMESVRGVNTKTAGPVFARAAAIAAKFPADAVVQGWLAETAYDARNLAAADAAADRALAADPKLPHALLYKGLIGMRRAESAANGDNRAAWVAARASIIKANKIDPNDAQPLYAFYQSFAREGREPTKNAIAGLYRAQVLAPQDDDLRITAVFQKIADGDLVEAKRLLKPLAFSPHGGASTFAAKLLTALEGAKDKAAALEAIKTLSETPKDDKPEVE